MKNPVSSPLARIAIASIVLAGLAIAGANILTSDETGDTVITIHDPKSASSSESKREDAPPPPGVPADEAALAMPGDELFRGTLELEHDGEPFGTEEYRITRKGTQVFLDARRRTRTEPAEKLVMTFTEDFDFRRAEWTRYGPDRIDVRYRREGAAVRATTTENDRPVAEEVRLGAGGTLFPTFHCAAMALFPVIGADAPETVTIPVARIGAPDWRMIAAEVTISRVPDGSGNGAAPDEAALAFDLRLTTPGEPDEAARLRFTRGGRLLRSELATPEGTRTASHRPVDAATDRAPAPRADD